MLNAWVIFYVSSDLALKHTEKCKIVLPWDDVYTCATD
jgi:hypothetical protein